MLRNLALVAGCLLAAPFSFACEGLDIDQAWIRAMPPGPDVTAGYLTLQNRSNRPVEIKAIESPAFERIELHETRQVGSTMQMRELDQLVIMPGNTETFAPGGKHLMLFSPAEDWAATGSITLTIYCGITEQLVEAEIRNPDANETMSGHHDHHKGQH